MASHHGRVRNVPVANLVLVLVAIVVIIVFVQIYKRRK